jgi:hypothetical protein
MGGRPEYHEWVEWLREGAAREERERREYWRHAPMEEHARVLKELLDLTDRVVRSRGRPVEKPPLPDEPFPWPSLRAGDHELTRPGSTPLS